MSSKAKKAKWASSVFTQLEKFQDTKEPDSCEENKQPANSNDSAASTSSTSSGADLNIPPPCTKRKLQPEKSRDLKSTEWIDSFAPTDVDDVAVQPKKMLELQNWLLHCDAVRLKHPAQLCLLTGPSGCGKTTAARLLAKKQRYQLQEWINPVDRDVITSLGDQTNVHVGSQIEAFKSFLLRASRYKSLFSGGGRRMLMVEDFPNALLRDPALFEEILEDYKNYGLSPLLFIATDSKSRTLNIGYNLFTDQLKQKFQINHISFNAIAVTLLQKAMKKFCVLMRTPELADNYKVPTQRVVDSIVIGAQGDIRNALINLHFSSLKGAVNVATQKLETEYDKNGKAKKSQTKLKSIGRDESITTLHAIGRVLNPGLKTNGRFIHSPEEVSEVFTTEPKTCLNLLHANYLQHFSDLEYTLEAIDGLSIADNIIMEYREDMLAATALNIAVRSIMVANKVPVKGWMPVRAAKRLPEKLPGQRLTGISSSLFATEYNTYVRHFPYLQTEAKHKYGTESKVTKSTWQK